MDILLYFLLTLHILVCVLMVLVVLMQRPRSEGLGAAFGSGMTDNIFGAQTTHVLAKFTTWLGGAFFVLTLALAMLYSHLNSGDSVIQKDVRAIAAKETAATASPSPAPAATAVPAASSEATQPVETTAPAASPSPVATTPAPQPVASPAPAAPATTP
jgi:preprotein translocase subunit SecG